MFIPENILQLSVTVKKGIEFSVKKAVFPLTDEDPSKDIFQMFNGRFDIKPRTIGGFVFHEINNPGINGPDNLFFVPEMVIEVPGAYSSGIRNMIGGDILGPAFIEKLNRDFNNPVFSIHVNTDQSVTLTHILE